jgi:hypothetical protein
MGDSALYILMSPFAASERHFSLKSTPQTKNDLKPLFLLDFTQFVQVASSLFPRTDCLVPVVFF